MKKKKKKKKILIIIIIIMMMTIIIIITITITIIRQRYTTGRTHPPVGQLVAVDDNDTTETTNKG